MYNKFLHNLTLYIKQQSKIILVYLNKYCVFFLWSCGPTRAMASSFLRFLDHTQ